MDVVLEAPDPLLAGTDAAPKGGGCQATLLGGEDARVLTLDRRIGLRAMAGRQPRDHSGEGISVGASQAEHPGQGRGGRRRRGEVDLGIHVEVGEREHEVRKDVVMDVLITTFDAPQPAHHLPLLPDQRVVTIQVEDQRREAILEEMPLGFFRNETKATERVRMHIGEVVGLHGVLYRNLPVAVERCGVAPVADVWERKSAGDRLAVGTQMVGKRRALRSKPNKNQATAGIDRKRLEPGIFTVEGTKAASVGNPRDLARRSVFPTVILAGKLFAIPPGQFGQQAVAV